MRKYGFSILIFIVTGLTCFAQKETRKTINAENIVDIFIEANEVFKINIIAENRNSIQFSTHSEGEYFNNIAVLSEVREHQVLLKTQYPDRLVGGFDKLSAHKVFSIELELYVPNNKLVSVSSNSGSIKATGNFSNFIANLKEGHCYLDRFVGNAQINTYFGDIRVETNNAQIKATSRHGKVNVAKPLNGLHQIKLNSINGDISVVKTK
ncbi:DUF4097 family beta strand repeat-containing protein [Zunongwangia sp.]|uniref:DUF4097 family beta strand repeat-containing protein n=1 Tax=Zunongwangia sp. TaxID=1965325 RepID=UPI003AA96361